MIIIKENDRFEIITGIINNINSMFDNITEENNDKYKEEINRNIKNLERLEYDATDIRNKYNKLFRKRNKE